MRHTTQTTTKGQNTLTAKNNLAVRTLMQDLEQEAEATPSGRAFRGWNESRWHHLQQLLEDLDWFLQMEDD